MMKVKNKVYQASLEYSAAQLSRFNFSCQADFFELNKGVVESEPQTPIPLGKIKC